MSGAETDLGSRLDNHHEPVTVPSATSCFSCGTHTADGKHVPHEAERERGEAFLRIFDPIPAPRRSVTALPRLPSWTRDPARVEHALARRGRAGPQARETWHALLLVALDLDDLVRALVVGDAGRMAALVRQLDLAVGGLVPSLPFSSAPQRLVRRLLLAAFAHHDAGGMPVALAVTLAEDAAILAALVDAPVARDDTALMGEAADVLADLAPLLSAWAERTPRADPPLALAPEPEEPPPWGLDDRY